MTRSHIYIYINISKEIKMCFYCCKPQTCRQCVPAARGSILHPPRASQVQYHTKKYKTEYIWTHWEGGDFPNIFSPPFRVRLLEFKWHPPPSPPPPRPPLPYIPGRFSPRTFPPVVPPLYYIPDRFSTSVPSIPPVVPPIYPTESAMSWMGI